MKSDIQIQNMLLNTVIASEDRLTPRELERRLSQESGENSISRRDMARILKDLVHSGLLSYTYEFGTSFISISFSRPVRIGKTIILVPEGINPESNPEDKIIRIAPGASFGTGDHPTTRICIKQIEIIREAYPGIFQKPDGIALDIGTGNGILAAVLLIMGIERAIGIDIDPCSESEALFNMRINGIQKRFEFVDKKIGALSDRFDLIAANLRSPTLLDMAPDIRRRIQPTGVIILSGIRSDEVPRIREVYSNLGFSFLGIEHEKNWASVSFVQRD